MSMVTVSGVTVSGDTAAMMGTAMIGTGADRVPPQSVLPAWTEMLRADGGFLPRLGGNLAAALLYFLLAAR